MEYIVILTSPIPEVSIGPFYIYPSTRGMRGVCANGVLGRLVTRFLVSGTELFDLNSSSTHIGTVEVPHTTRYYVPSTSKYTFENHSDMI